MYEKVWYYYAKMSKTCTILHTKYFYLSLTLSIISHYMFISTSITFTTEWQFVILVTWSRSTKLLYVRPSQYLVLVGHHVTSHQSQLNLAILPWIGAPSTNKSWEKTCTSSNSLALYPQSQNKLMSGPMGLRACGRTLLYFTLNTHTMAIFQICRQPLERFGVEYLKAWMLS